MIKSQKRKKRNLTDITINEAIEVLKLGEGIQESAKYQLRRKISPCWDTPFAQLFHRDNAEEHISANFSDDANAVSLCEGNTYYRTMYRIVKYLEKQGFNLEKANRTY